MAGLTFGAFSVLFVLVFTHNVLAAFIFRFLKKKSAESGQVAPLLSEDGLPATFFELMGFIWTAKARSVDADQRLSRE